MNPLVHDGIGDLLDLRGADAIVEVRRLNVTGEQDRWYAVSMIHVGPGWIAINEDCNQLVLNYLVSNHASFEVMDWEVEHDVGSSNFKTTWARKGKAEAVRNNDIRISAEEAA